MMNVKATKIFDDFRKIEESTTMLDAYEQAQCKDFWIKSYIKNGKRNI